MKPGRWATGPMRVASLPTWARDSQSMVISNGLNLNLRKEEHPTQDAPFKYEACLEGEVTVSEGTVKEMGTMLLIVQVIGSFNAGWAILEYVEDIARQVEWRSPILWPVLIP